MPSGQGVDGGNGGSAGTGATGGAHNRYPCRYAGTPGHASSYSCFVAGGVCETCKVCSATSLHPEKSKACNWNLTMTIGLWTPVAETRKTESAILQTATNHVPGFGSAHRFKAYVFHSIFRP